MNYYLCPECCAITQRESGANRIKSDCLSSGKIKTLVRIKNAEDLAKRLSKLFLKNQFDLNSFKPKERLYLKMAFEQGVKVVYNGIKSNTYKL